MRRFVAEWFFLTTTVDDMTILSARIVYEKLGVCSPFDSTASFATSPFLSPHALAFIRILLAFYTLFTLVFCLVWDAVRENSADRFVC